MDDPGPREVGLPVVWQRQEGAEELGGDGGVGVLVRRGIGVCKVVRTSLEHDMMWVELKRGTSSLFIGAVYMCPEGSSRNNDVKGQMIELEADIADFRRKGNVLCMGDFNSRIGCHESAVIKGDQCVSFPRQSQDMKVGSAAERGTQFVEAMNACNMVILNGIDAMAEYTFRSEQGQSVVDLLIVDDRMVGLDTSELDGDGVHELEEEEEPRCSARYVASSLRVWDEEVARLSDHKLVTCVLEVEVGEPVAIAANPEPEAVEEPELGWRRRDGGDRKFWAGLEAAGNIHMDSWLDK